MAYKWVFSDSKKGIAARIKNYEIDQVGIFSWEVKHLQDFKLNICIYVIHRMVKDQPKLWQAAWLLSALPTIVGLLSLPKNNTKQLYIYAFATLFIGVGPLAFGACVMVQEIFYNVSQGRAPATREHQMAPMKMALSAFLIQFHGISLYYANKLITAWSSKGEKKNS